LPVRVGLTVQSYKGIETSFILALVKRFGLEYVEITKSVFEEVDKIIPLVRKIRTGFHLPIICEDNYDFSCPAHEQDINQLIDLLSMHWRDLNIRYILAHPPEPKEARSPIETSIPYLFENLSRLPTHVFIENVPSWDVAAFDQFLSDAKKALGKKLSGICFDAPHFFIKSVDPLVQLTRYQDQMKCVHLSDCIEGVDRHLPFGTEGRLPIDDFLNALKAQHYNEYIDLELLPRTLDDLPYVIYSYLKVLKKFRPLKYYRTKIRTLVILPVIRKLLAR